MRHILQRLALITVCLGFLVFTAVSAWALQLTLVHTSDVHGHYESSDAAGRFGGSARHMAFFQQINQTYPTVVIADTGDQSDKSPYVDMFGAELVSLNMRELGYGVWTLGNHEFSYGIAGLEQMTGDGMPPLLCANIKFKNNDALAQKIQPWTYKYSDGRKIGFIGVTTTSYVRDNADWELTEPKAAVKQAVTELEAEGVNVIVLLSHCGYDLDLEMANEIAGLDIILGGHYHMLFSNTEDGADHNAYPMVIDNGRQQVLYSNVGEYGKYVGLLTVDFDGAGLPTAFKGDSVLIDDSVTANVGVAPFLLPYKAKLDVALGQVIGSTLTPLNGDKGAVLCGESAAANLMGDAFLAAGKPYGAQIAMFHDYSVGWDTYPAGPITLKTLKGLLAQSYRMFAVDVKGDTLLNTLETSLSLWESWNNGDGDILLFAGLRYRADMARPVGQRVISVEVLDNGTYKALESEKVYRVVTYGYLAGRSDCYPVFKDNILKRTPLERTSESILNEYIRQNSPVNPPMAGRAVILNLP